MAEEKPKRGLNGDSRSTWAYILIGVGVIILVVNLLNISLFRLWPLVLVAIGLALLFGRNSIGSTARTGYFSAPLDDVDEADVDVRLSVGEASVRPLSADSDQLIDAELTYMGDIDFHVDGSRVVLKQTGDSGLKWINPATWFHNWDEGLPWRIGLSRRVPMRLALHGGVGETNADLAPLQVTHLTLRNGVGKMSVTLPDSGAPYEAAVDGGLGELRLALPNSTSLGLRIKGGVGEITLEAPLHAAVQLSARGGIGDVRLPDRMQRVAGGSSDFELSKSGTWETPGFASAPVQIRIDYEGGVGELRLR